MNICNFTKIFLMAALYLIPSNIGDSDWQYTLPAGISGIIMNTRFFIVENVRTARRFLKWVNRETDIDRLEFFELNKHTAPADIPSYLIPLSQGHDMAVISEAGCPGVADPGAAVVRLAHQKGFQVVPLVGPSSVLLALMASGLNGQHFAFNGYLPVRPNERLREIGQLENQMKKTGQTQIFIETPYRNNALVKDLLKSCSPDTLLCIAANLTGEKEFIVTRSVAQWKGKVPDLHKQPAVFLIGN
jgi:16S rRNA (cytidine1402-2'-O)-methyltransferase